MDPPYHRVWFRVSLAQGRLDLQPFVEGTFGKVGLVQPGLFDPELFYGKESVRSLSVGVRAAWQLRGHRMGRYGALLDEQRRWPWRMTISIRCEEGTG